MKIFVTSCLRDEAGGNENGSVFSLQTFTILFLMTPIPSTSVSMTSPSFIYSGGVRPRPTPSGVPVAMMSPGSSVIPFDRDSMETSMGKIMFAVVES